ncbi:hypothetical protein ABZ912_05170 [Nonomuraea angiospora]|uniref:hypothetical protein n=1 Tax=Nonomuraea angiospora TaxID=46172 RepID=UPI0033D73AD4
MTKEVVMLIIGVLVAEGSEVAPWLAKRLVRWSAHIRHLDARRAEVRAEEWAAVIESRPGKLFKLITALLFTLQAGAAWGSRLPKWLQLYWQISKDFDHRQPTTPAEPSFKEILETLPIQNTRDFMSKSERTMMVANSSVLSHGDISGKNIMAWHGPPPANIYVQRPGRARRPYRDAAGPPTSASSN